MRHRLHSAIAVVLAASATTVVAAPPPGYDGSVGWVKISPKMTFYSYDEFKDKTAELPVFIALWGLPGSSTQRTLVVEVFGDYTSKATESDTRQTLNGIFTYRNTIHPTQYRYVARLSGADPGVQYHTYTGLTSPGNLVTDLTTDFRVCIDSRTKQFRIPMPPNVSFVTFCAPDSYYGDNRDPDNDFWIRVQRK
jgi:hypothetical protein